MSLVEKLLDAYPVETGMPQVLLVRLEGEHVAPAPGPPAVAS
jgi:hypothetical protein